MHPDTILAFGRSSMILNVHSNAFYLCEPKPKIRAGGHLFSLDNVRNPKENVTLLTRATLMKNVNSSAAEAEKGALFLNSIHAVPAGTNLIEIGYP